MNRKSFTPQPGSGYKNQSGGIFDCIGTPEPEHGNAVLMRNKEHRGMKTAEKKTAGIMRRLANENFSLPDLDVSFSYTGENTKEREKESEQFSRQFLQGVEKRRGTIC